MDLPAMMGLMVEEMDQSRRQGLLDLGRIRDRPVADASRQIGIGKAVDIADDPLVLPRARRTKLGKILEQDRIEPVRRFARLRRSASSRCGR